ncbi:MAG: methyltransferase domain-containing protein [Pseudomonadota bacterium]
MSTETMALHDPATISQHRMQQMIYWNSGAAVTWVAQQEILDTMLAPFNQLLLTELARLEPRTVLDVGCGFGTTSLEIAAALGADGQCFGIDISKVMLEHALARLEDATYKPQFIYHDASDYPFEAVSADLLVSRFGVMFFADPVAAFTNLRAAAKPRAATAFIAWRAQAENEFIALGHNIAAQRLADLGIKTPERATTDPGPFSLADAARTKAILEAAGWQDVAIEPHDVPCTIPRDQLDSYITKFAAMRQDMTTVSDEQSASILSDILNAYGKFAEGDEVRFTGCIWLIKARAPI